MAYLSDIEIAQACMPQHILKIAERAGIAPEFIEQYGNYKAKIDLRYLDCAKKSGKLEALEKGLKLSAFLHRFGIDISRKLFAEVYDVLGGKLRYFLCGGAPLDKQLVEFFDALGITVLQGYGITECLPIVAANLPEANRIGSVGRQFKCC